MKICFVTTYIGPPNLSDISNNFERVVDCDYLLFTNLHSDQIKSGWNVMTIDLEEFNYLKSAVKVSRYFKFMVHEYLKKIGREYDFVFYCDSYKYPKHTINWTEVCNILETNDTGIMQYRHTCLGDNMNVSLELDCIVDAGKDTRENMKATRRYLKNIDQSVDMNKNQYFENSILGFHLKNEYAISQCNEFWKYYVNCPTYRDQPLWNFLYLKNNKKPYVENKLTEMYGSGNRKSRHLQQYTDANVVIAKKDSLRK